MKTREMTGKFQNWQKRASETARNVGQSTDEVVHENAWIALGIAAVFGCVVGYLLARSRD